MMKADILIVGAGAAGAVLAGRLACETGLDILLIEAGGEAHHPFYRVPLLTGRLAASKRGTWRRTVEPGAGSGFRAMEWPQGKVVGGSSAINGMVWMRGRPSDYDGWAAQVSDDWSWTEVARCFDRIERDAPDAPGIPIGLHEGTSPLYDAFVAAGVEAGFPPIANLNAAPFEGVARFASNVVQGRRWSAADGFLRAARRRRNFRLLTGAQVRGIRMKDGRATGVTLVRNGRRIDIEAGETILCAGAVNSPALLLASGIGDAVRTGATGIRPLADLPGVGENLQDHFCARVSVACREPVSLHGITQIDRAAIAFLRGLILGVGPAAASPFGAGFVLRSDPGLAEPDIEGVFVPALSTARLRPPALLGGRVEHAYTCAVYPLRPKSRGRIALNGPDPDDVLIQPGYLGDPDDLARTRAGLHIVRRIFAQPAFDRYRGAELLPGSAAIDDAALDRAIAETANTAFHPAGTCRMGRADDPMAVVDPMLRVHGIGGLRVADASIMPTITSGNTAAPAMMIGYRCADFILRERA